MKINLHKKTTVGLDNLLSSDTENLRGRRIGILAHPASVTSDLRHILPALRDAGAKVEVLFGPEHGFGGEAQDMEPVNTAVEGPFGIPLHSLYGSTVETLAPKSAALAGLDALIVDLMDVGARYYTFIWTAVLCLRACREAGVQMIVLDRPNPLGGNAVEGIPQQAGYLSFVGLEPIPVRHGLTIGELCRLIAHRDGSTDLLRVIPMCGWKRDMFFEDTQLPWIAPSPNMPTVDTAFVYPGGCLLEATNVSEGRGTTQPFVLFGAPGLDNRRLCTELNNAGLQGVHFRDVSFKPMFHKHAGHLCAGAAIHVLDRTTFLPLRTGVAVLKALRANPGSTFEWRHAPYEFVADIPAIDLLAGSSALRTALETDVPLDEVFHSWDEGEKAFRAEKKQFHLYD